MRFILLSQENAEDLLNLEEKMYWDGDKWKGLWQREAKGRFREFIKDYLTNSPQGCFGLSEDGELIGAMFLIKISKMKPIPYLHRFSKYFKPDGEIAYVSFFVVKKGQKQKEITRKLYEKAGEMASELGCTTIAVVIYSSPLEEKIIIEKNYQKLAQKFNWKIYPSMKVPCRIYLKTFN